MGAWIVNISNDSLARLKRFSRQAFAWVAACALAFGAGACRRSGVVVAAPAPGLAPAPAQSIPARDPVVARIMGGVDMAWQSLRARQRSGPEAVFGADELDRILAGMTELSGTDKAATSAEFGERIADMRAAVDFAKVVQQTHDARRTPESRRELDSAISEIDRACMRCHIKFRNS